jgi:hypothetical protein
MLTRIIYLTVRYYFVTLIALVLFYLIFVAYYHVNETLLFVFTVLLAWLQPVIDKVREIKRQVELETPRARVREVASTAEINWRAFFGLVGKPLVIVVLLLLAAFFLVYLYLFIRLRHWW